MKNLTIGKLALGVLMMFVLALGVQSIADALTFQDHNQSDGDLQTLYPGDRFTISFRVNLTVPAQKTNTAGRRVAEDGATQINSTGYEVAYINNRAYRPTATPTGITQLVVSTPAYSTQGTATPATPPYYVPDGTTDAAGRVYDSLGRAVSDQTGGSGTPASTGVTADPWTYASVTAAPNAVVAAADTDSERWAYNDEAIAIAVTGATGNLSLRKGTTLLNVLSAIPTTRITSPPDSPLSFASGGNAADISLIEETNNRDVETDLTLTSSISLTGTAPTTLGAYIITIMDVTHSADFPTVPVSQESHTFTIYVVSPPSGVQGSTTGFSTSPAFDGVEYIFDGTDRQIDSDFSFTGAGVVTSLPVQYSVEGTGNVYVGVSGDRTRRTRSTKSLLTSSAADVFLETNRGTSKVTAWVLGNLSHTAIYIYQGTSPGNYVQLEITQGDGQVGATGGRLEDYLEVKVTDGNNRPLSGVAVGFTDTDDGSFFIPVSGTRVYVDTADALVATLADPLNAATFQATSSKPAPANAIFVQTDSAGLARVYYQLDTDANTPRVTAALTGSPATGSQVFRATAESGARTASLEIVSGDGQSAAKGAPLANPLVVIARSTANHRIAGVQIEFETTAGILERAPGTAAPGTNPGPSSGQEILAVTGSDGTASVVYNVGQVSGARSVIAEVTDEQDANVDYDFVIERVEFRINGTGSGGSDPPTSARSELTLSPSIITGAPGEQRSFTITLYDNGEPLANTPVSLTGATFTNNFPSTNSRGTATGTVTIPNSPTTITATAAGYSATATITVEAVASSIVRVSGHSPVQTGNPGTQLSSPFVVRVNDRNNNPLRDQTVTFRVTGGGGSVSPSTVTTDSSGQASATLTLGSAAGTNTVTASVGTLSPATFTATARTLIRRLELDIGNNQSGEINSALSQPLSVRIVDQDGNGIPGQLVTFSVTEGSGRFSPIRPQITTDRNGYASTTFTPRSAGAIEIEASSGDLTPVIFTITTGDPPDAIVMVSGNNQSGRPGARLANPFVVEVVDENDDPVSGVTVTFAVTAGGGSVSPTSATTNNNGRAQTRLTLGEALGDNTVTARVSGVSRAATFTARTGAEVLVGAAQRPPMYWVSRTEGKLHRLVGEEVENLAPNIDNILSLTVDTQNQLLYWTRQTAQSKSAIQRAGLNGRGVITLQTSLTLMTSLAVNSTGTTLYWADILGKIKSRPVQGNRVTLLAQNLSSPTGLVWANDYLYWGEATGQIRRMNLRNNRRTIETITTSSGEPVSLAVQSGRVYWTEISGNAAQLNRVNTNGTGLEALKTLVGSRRVWVDVDGSASKLYLTRASKLERRGLSGRSTVTLVSGLASPGSLVLGGELPTSPPVVSQPTQPTQPTQPPVASKYDVNQDGSVNNADTRAVAGAVGQSGAAITNPRTDVDGSGTVDVTDLILVIANLDADVAAPTIDIDVKALDVDFDRVQEQVEVLLASGDRSIAAQRALLYLQHLLASARPDETVLLANYPNPFNPETWIPYHLAESTEVRVNIYDAQGVLVRVLPLGHQTAGYYTSRSRAAYWDGLNALGERVASGIYFYQLQTDAVSPMRKMVILK